MSELSLVEFLTARLDEDEAVARGAISPDRPGTHWRWYENDTDREWTPDSDEYRVSLRTVEEFPTQSVGPLPAFPLGYVEADGDEEPGAMAHIARHDPARVLAEVEAKRRIVELHPDMLDWCQGCAHEPFPCRTLRTLALPYADHPDYRPEWRP